MTKRTLIFVTVLLALLSIIFFTEKRSGEMAQSAATESAVLSSKFLFAENDSGVAGFKIVIGDGEILELARGDFGLWVAIQPFSADVQQGVVEAAVSQLRSLPVLAEDLSLSASDVGVREQATQVSVSFADGETSAFQIGDLIPSGSGYYIQSADGTINIVEKDGLDTFLNILHYFGF